MKSVSIEQLKQGKIWTNWNLVTKNGRQTKKPTSKVNNPATWLTYQQAKSGLQHGATGIGLMFAGYKQGFCICGIDIDAHHAVSNPLTHDILTMFSGTYVEVSPSGKGYHILFLADVRRLPDAATYKDKYYQKNSALDVECYISGRTNRYFTFTGNQTSQSDKLIDMTDMLNCFLNKYMLRDADTLSLKLTGEKAAAISTDSNSIDNIDTDIDKRLKVAMHARNGQLFSALYHGDTSAYRSSSEAVQAFIDMLVFYFGNDGAAAVKQVFLMSGLAVGKWSERDDIIDTTIDNAFQRVTQRYTPAYNTTHTQHIQSSDKSPVKKLTAERGGEEPKAKKPPLSDYWQFEKFLDSKKYSVRYNQITHIYEFQGFDKGESQEHLAETVPQILVDELKKVYSHVNIQTVTNYITRFATRHKYNPVLSAIQSVRWDGKDRISQIYDIFKIPDDEEGQFSRICIFKWLMQCVCGLYNSIDNPFSLDIVLVFQGRQGIGKTRFFEKLALRSVFFGEGICLDPRDKDSVIQATSKWISELGELGSTMRKDMDSVKAFLTKSTDEYRTPYGKASLHYPRLTSFVGTVNDAEFLLDETGNRRFVTIPLSPDLKIDYETQIKPFDALQLWAQVYDMVKDDDKASCFRLTEAEKMHLEKRNAKFIKPMKGEYEVLDILEDAQTPQPGYTCTFKEMTVLQFIQLHGLRYEARAVGKILNKYGYESVRRKTDGTVSRLIRLPYKYYSSGK